MPESQPEPITLVKAVEKYLLLPGEKISLAAYKKFTATDLDDLRASFEKMGVQIRAAKGN